MYNKFISTESIESFRAALLKDEKSTATIEKYVRDVGAFKRYADGRKIDKQLVMDYKSHIMESYAPASVNSMLASLNCYFKFMGWYDFTVKAVKLQRQSFRTSERVLSREEYFRLLDAADQAGNRRLYLLLQTICSTGIRVSELSAITLEAAQRGMAQVSLKGKTRQVLLPGSLSAQLLQYASERGISTGCIFITRSGKPMDRSNILHEMKALCNTAGVDSSKVFPHNLRHLFACCYYDAEHDLSRLADILGHSNLNTTRIYTCISLEQHQRQIESLGLVLSNCK